MEYSERPGGLTLIHEKPEVISCETPFKHRRVQQSFYLG
jgi:hypothetical protein